MTASATRKDHKLFFGPTKAEIFENLNAQQVVSFPVKKVNSIDRSCRQHCIKFITDALANLTQLASKYVALRDLRAALDGEPPQSKRRMFLNSLQNPANLH